MVGAKDRSSVGGLRAGDFPVQ